MIAAWTQKDDLRDKVILLVRIQVAGIDGYDVARRLRQQPDLEGVKIIAMTGYGRESDLQRSQEAGVLSGPRLARLPSTGRR
jgi:CheY-like chemotaxis protein